MLLDIDILKARILIVDDNQLNIDLLEQTVAAAGYSSIISLTDSRKVKDLYMAYQPDLLLLDINMPHLNGYQVIQQLKEVEKESYLPILVVTAQQDEETRLRSLKEGAQDFLTKPFNTLEVVTKIRNMLRIRLLHNQVRDQNILLEKRVQERTIELNNTRLEIIRRLGQASEYRDNETGAHIVRMSSMCALLGRLTGMSDARVDLLLNTSPMHDVGKIGIPDKILLKPGKLDDEEWRIMTRHTTIGADLLGGHDSKLMKLASEIALTHHEKWDGSGYPNGLRGEEIILEGRICALIDVFDVLTSRRPYKDPYPVDKACEIIKEGRGRHFDPDLTDLFFKNLDDFVKLKAEWSDQESVTAADYQLSERDRKN